LREHKISGSEDYKYYPFGLLHAGQMQGEAMRIKDDGKWKVGARGTRK